MDTRSHWEQIYKSKRPEQLSWFQQEATLSHELITLLAPAHNAHIIDVGAGASTLVDGLLATGYRRITALDLSVSALAEAQNRLGHVGATVKWMPADVLSVSLPSSTFDVWHDRAVFHFLTDASDRTHYVNQVRRTVRPGGVVLVATFAEDGPSRCSGLDVRRYSAQALHREFGTEFGLVESRRQAHTTPTGAMQAFTYCAFRFQPAKYTQDATQADAAAGVAHEAK